MMDAAATGKLKALYVVGANPVKTFRRSRELARQTGIPGGP